MLLHRQLEGKRGDSLLKSAEVWCTCVKYLATRMIDKRISNDPNTAQFLLVNFARTTHFYQVSMDVNTKQDKSGAWRQQVCSKRTLLRESGVVFEFAMAQIKPSKSPDLRPPRCKKSRTDERSNIRLDLFRPSIDTSSPSLTPRTSIESLLRRESPSLSRERSRPATTRASSLVSSVESLQRFPSAEEINSQKTIPVSSVTSVLASNMSLFKSISPASNSLSDLRKSLTDLKSELSNMSRKLENKSPRCI